MANETANQLFSEAELQPKSGYPNPDTSRQRLSALQAWNETLETIYIHNPNHTPVHRALDEVLALGRPGKHYAVRNSAESFAGKSASAEEFARIVRSRGTYPLAGKAIVRVELEQACTSRRFWTSILERYEDGFTSRKDEGELRRSAYDAFEEHGTVLLVIDEVQHAGFRSNGSSAATDVIKRFISDGRVGIGLFGNEKAAEHFQTNNQLGHRLLPPCDIKPLVLGNDADQKTFAKFLVKYDQKLTATKCFHVSSELGDPRTVSCLMAVSKGYLGRVVALLQVAARRAFLRGADHIEICDLSHATSTWAVGQSFIATDPFRFGVAKKG